MTLMPRLAEYPRTSQKRQHSVQREAFTKLPLHVVQGFVTDVYGEIELDKIAGLPVSTLVYLYPETMCEVATFEAIRETPALAQIQSLADTVSTVMTSHSYDSQVRCLTVLGVLNDWFRATHRSDLDDWLAIEEESLFRDLRWMAPVVLGGNSKVAAPNKFRDEGLAVYSLAGVLAARVMAPQSLREALAVNAARFDETFGIFGLPELVGLFDHAEAA